MVEKSCKLIIGEGRGDKRGGGVCGRGGGGGGEERQNKRLFEI